MLCGLFCPEFNLIGFKQAYWCCVQSERRICRLRAEKQSFTFQGRKKNHKDNLSDKAVKHNALFGNDANLLIHLTGKVNAPGLAKRLFFICNLHD